MVDIIITWPENILVLLQYSRVDDKTKLMQDDIKLINNATFMLRSITDNELLMNINHDT